MRDRSCPYIGGWINLNAALKHAGKVHWDVTLPDVHNIALGGRTETEPSSSVVRTCGSLLEQCRRYDADRRLSYTSPDADDECDRDLCVYMRVRMRECVMCLRACAAGEHART